MINFKNISMQNFQSYGNVPTVFDLTGFNTCLISGKNGSGKSTIIDAICFTLFGKPFRNVNKPTLVNTINGKKCVTICEFSIGTDEYKVVRGIKPAIFEIWKNDSKIDQDAATKDYQEILEDNILQINYKTFTQIAIMSNAGFKPFMQLSAADRRSVIDDLLDMNIFSLMSKVAKEKTVAVQQKIGQIDNVVVNYKSKIQTLESFITKIKNEVAVNDGEIENKINEILFAKEEHTKVIEKLTETKKDLYESITDAPEVTTKKSEIWNASLKMSHVKSGMVTEQQFLLKNNNCPTCKQLISEDFKNSKITSLTEAITKRENALQIATDTIKKYDIRLTEVGEIIAKIKTIDSEISQKNTLLNNGVWIISQLEKEKNKKIVSTKSEEDELIKSEKLLLKTIEERDGLVEEKSYLDIANVLLKDNGIKSNIVKQYVPILNKLINHYLEIMDFFVKFSFDENLNDTIKLRQRDELSYFNLSEGQKKRIDLSIIFAFRKISESKNICNTNILFFDEILDSSLDEEGVECINSILETFQDKNIFVISHKENVGETFDKHIKVSLKNNYSVIS